MSILNFISAVNQVAERVQSQQPAFDPALSALLDFDHYFARWPFGARLQTTVDRDLSDGFHLSPFSKALSEREGEGGSGIKVKDLCCNWRKDGRKKNWTSSVDRKSESRAASRDNRGRHSSDWLLRRGKRKGRPCVSFTPAQYIHPVFSERDIRRHGQRNCQIFKDTVLN